jgi:hypothetical protein
MDITIKTIKEFNYEIAHYTDSALKIFSKFNKITVYIEDRIDVEIKLPINFRQFLFGKFRILRRFLRLDKMCVTPVTNGYVVFWQGDVYHATKQGRLKHTLKLESCRNPLHNSIANINGEVLYFGEYGNKTSKGKSVYKSEDGGLSWKNVYNISCNKIKHIHACKWDPYEEKVWILTGDFEEESYLICADKEFKNVEWIGDGSQYYRTLDLIFQENEVHWCMDSPLIDSRHIILDRKTRTISKNQIFPGPVWYMKQLSSGDILVSTAQEIGPSHKDKKLHIMHTTDLETWADIAQFQHDGLKKRYFKFGVICFSDGEQDKQGFFIHAEAVRHYDGKTLLCCLME